MQAIRHGTMLPSLSQNKIGTSELDPFIAVEMAIADYHRVAGGSRPPPAPTERSMRIYRTTLFGS